MVSRLRGGSDLIRWSLSQAIEWLTSGPWPLRCASSLERGDDTVCHYARSLHPYIRTCIRPLKKAPTSMKEENWGLPRATMLMGTQGR